HAGVRPDVLVAAKGSTSGYTPFGFAAASGEVHDAIVDGGGFVHGFTYSHHVVGAAVAGEVLRILEDEALLEASASKGERLQALLAMALGDHRHVGEIRVTGLFAGLELVADRGTREPFPRTGRVAELIVREARANGLLVYSGTGMADGTNGDAIVLGPPFVVTDAELATIVERLASAIDTITSAVPAATGTGARA
ncbi:MAG: aminotransferase class III-fold pyridoxal phosphate-dependent enzyme, partial [Chloroflexi bacterium]|nr:aminotransferase class III-fold pyridoxal phosphate-dependent enzyme [Chloroflexota bacterium]